MGFKFDQEPGTEDLVTEVSSELTNKGEQLKESVIRAKTEIDSALETFEKGIF